MSQQATLLKLFMIIDPCSGPLCQQLRLIMNGFQVGTVKNLTFISSRRGVVELEHELVIIDNENSLFLESFMWLKYTRHFSKG